MAYKANTILPVFLNNRPYPFKGLAILIILLSMLSCSDDEPSIEKFDLTSEWRLTEIGGSILLYCETDELDSLKYRRRPLAII